MTNPQANQALRALLTEAGLTHAAFARRVNAAGDALPNPLHLRYCKDSVSWWLRGRRPHAPIQDLVAAVLTERLGRPVTTVDCGFPADALAGLEYPYDVADAIRAVDRLASGAGATTRVDPVALVVAVWRWWHGSASPPTARAQPAADQARDAPDDRAAERAGGATGGSARAGTTALAGATAHLTALRRSEPVDSLRPLLDQHLRAAAEQPHPEDPGWCAAFARLLALAAGAARDTGIAGTAQRHLIQALRLAAAAGEDAYGAELVLELSSLAEEAGHPREAAELARMARCVLPGAAARPASARLHYALSRAALSGADGWRPVPPQRAAGGRRPGEGHRTRPADVPGEHQPEARGRGTGSP
jgi:transcriptional regulator with XRE-family HTH domain